MSHRLPVLIPFLAIAIASAGNQSSVAASSGDDTSEAATAKTILMRDFRFVPKILSTHARKLRITARTVVTWSTSSC
jgi:hypothetical protein